jgi:hypothetical protein
MNKSDVKVGQVWKSKYAFPQIGQYTVEILEVSQETLKTRFTASEWKDKHWVYADMKMSSLLEGYDLQ